MKIFTAFFLCLLNISLAMGQGYTVTLNTPDYKEGIAYLTYYYGKNLNIEDSAAVSNKGVAVFEKKEKLQPGIYSIVFPGKSKMFDFLVSGEQQISITADTSDLLNKLTIKGAPENDLFQQYQQFISSKSQGLQNEMMAYKASTTKADSVLHEERYSALNKELNDYREEIVNKHPESMLSRLLKSMKEPPVPGTRPVTHEDSVNNYQYYKKHYWDGIDFTDASIIRTPFFLPRFEKFYREVLPPDPDSIIKASDYMLLRARTSPDMYRFLLNWLTDEYISPKYMGQDAVFVHLFQKYHSQGVSSWLNEKQMTTITNRAYMLMSNQLGEPAADLEMVDTAGKAKPLYKVKADFTVVCFWDPTCSHCQHEVPRLDSFYQAKWKNLGVEVYSVLSETKEFAKWKDFLNEHKLTTWVNVYQTDARREALEKEKKPSYKQLYDITQTPTLYLLDAEKRIVAKKLSLDQIDELLDVKIKSDSAGKK